MRRTAEGWHAGVARAIPGRPAGTGHWSYVPAAAPTPARLPSSRPEAHARLAAGFPLPCPAVSQTSCPSPQWLATDQLHPTPSARELDWLNEQGSLTQRLTALSAERFAVEPLLEGWQILRADECAALGVPDGSEGWVREVYLHGAGVPWVFARSVAARSALQRHPFALDRLGSTSLGHLLFRDPAFTRLPIEACRYPAALLPAAVRTSGLWGRRSLFRQGPLGVLVAEVFLPALWQADAAADA